MGRNRRAAESLYHRTNQIRPPGQVYKEPIAVCRIYFVRNQNEPDGSE